MLLSIVLIKHKYVNFAQGSRILTILTYSYTIKQYLIKISLIVKVCYKNIGNKGDGFAHILFNFWKLIQNWIIFVENPPGIYELPFLFSFHS